MKKFSLLLIVASIFIIGCSKDDAGTTKTPSQLIQDGTWKFSDILENGISIKEDCDADNSLKFGPTIVTVFFGSIKCFSGEPDSEEVLYTLSADGKKITVDGDEATVTTLTPSALTFSYTDAGFTITYKFTK